MTDEGVLYVTCWNCLEAHPQWEDTQYCSQACLENWEFDLSLDVPDWMKS